MDSHFNAYKARFDTLDQIFRPIVQSQKIYTMNIYINLDDVIHTLHKPMINLEFQTAGINSHKQFLSNVINLIAHYHQWCIKRGFECKIVGVYTNSLRSFKNNLYVSEYRKKFSIQMDPTTADYYFINDAIRNAIRLMNTISRHISNIYLINTKYIEPSIIPLWLSQNMFSADWNVIISRDMYDLQYAYRDKWTYISPKGENTKVYNNTNLWTEIKWKENITEGDFYPYPMSLYPTAIAIVGDRYRNIPRLKRIGWKTLFKQFDLLYDAFNDQVESTIHQLLIEDIIKRKKIVIDELNRNLEATDLTLQCSKLSEIDKTMVLEQIVDTPDINSLLEINKQYLYEFPINLPFLTSTNRYK